jgi:hypothetical protein
VADLRNGAGATAAEETLAAAQLNISRLIDPRVAVIVDPVTELWRVSVHARVRVVAINTARAGDTKAISISVEAAIRLQTAEIDGVCALSKACEKVGVSAA